MASLLFVALEDTQEGASGRLKQSHHLVVTSGHHQLAVFAETAAVGRLLETVQAAQDLIGSGTVDLNLEKKKRQRHPGLRI